MRHASPFRRLLAALLLVCGLMLWANVPVALAAGPGSSHGIGLFLVLGFALLPVLARLVNRRRRGARARHVERAAAVAAADDPAFAPDAVRARAAELFVALQHARARGDRGVLVRMLAPGLLTEWCDQLDELDRNGFHRRTEVLEVTSVDYVGLVNREGVSDDRVTVRIRARMQDYLVTSDGQRLGADRARRDTFEWLGYFTNEALTDLVSYGRADGDLVDLAEFWTLARSADGRDWVVASVERDGEGSHVLDAQIVTSPWNDGRIADRSVLEVAALDKLPDDVSAAEVADLDYASDARTAALDLSLVDGRWAPAVLEASVRRAVAAWAEAVDGGRFDLLDVATPEAADALLHPGDPSGRTRRMVRGPRVRRLTIVALDPAPTPPTMTVDVELTGRRYLQDRATGAVVDGIPWLAVTITERWTLALLGPDDRPWRIVAAATGEPRRKMSALVDEARDLAGQFWTIVLQIRGRSR